MNWAAATNFIAIGIMLITGTVGIFGFVKALRLKKDVEEYRRVIRILVFCAQGWMLGWLLILLSIFLSGSSGWP